MKAGTYSVTSTFIDRAGGQASVCVHLLSSGLDIRNCLCGRRVPGLSGIHSLPKHLPAGSSRDTGPLNPPHCSVKTGLANNLSGSLIFAGMRRHAGSCHPPGGILSSLRLISPAHGDPVAVSVIQKSFPVEACQNRLQAEPLPVAWIVLYVNPQTKPLPGWQGFL